MKLYTLTRRFTAAVLTAAMALSFCAPALAEAPGTAADPAAPAASAPAENSTADTIVFDKLYFGTQKDWAKTITGDSSDDVALQYTAANRTLTVTGTYFQALTISAPGVNVVLNGTNGPAVKGDLTITASASVAVTSSAAGAQAVTGSTDITSDGAVSITGADRAVGGENLTVNAGGDVTITGGCEGASIWHSASITTTGSVTLTTNNSGGWVQGTAGTGTLMVDAGGDVTITGGTANQPTVNDATVRCGGEFELRNPAHGLVLCNKTSDGKSGNLHYYNTGATELVFRASSMGATCDVFQPGDSTVFGTLGDPSWITAKHEQSYQLTLTGCASADSAQGRTVFYAGEEVRLVLKRPVDGTTFTDWTVTKEDGTAVRFNQKGDSIRFTMPASAVKATANWERPKTGQALWLSTEQGWIIVTKASLEADPMPGITYENGTFIVDDIKAAKPLRVLGLAPTEDELPDVVLKNLTVDTLIVDGVRDVTLDACRIGELDNHDHLDTVYSLQITNARDVALANTSSRYSDISGVRNVTAKADDTLCDRLNIDCTGDIALSTAANTLGVACYLRAGGSIRLIGAPWYALQVSSAQNVTVDANALPQRAFFTCSGIVDITQRDGSAIGDSDAAWYLLEYYPETEQPYVVTLNGETGEVRSDLYQLDALDDLRAVQHLLITPTSLLPDDVDSDAVGQFITDASGVLVSAALAGAAVWGGYEVTTRVMLKNLLPEGTAIPATRGELAQLLWNAAGRPEAGAVVTVYPDITDADQQAAARWCTEQGLLTARSDGTFAPDARVPKWRVIEVWNKAFARK